MNFHEIRAERNSASDQDMEVIQFHFKDGDEIRAGQVVADLEGAKAVFELKSSVAGFAHRLVAEGSVVGVSALIAVVNPLRPLTVEELNSLIGHSQSEPLVDQHKTSFSKKAIALLESSGLTSNFFAKEEFVTEEMVRQAIAQQTDLDLTLEPTEMLDKGRIVLIGGGNGALVAREAIIAKDSADYVIEGVFDDQNNSLEKFGVPTLGGLREDVILAAWKRGEFDGVLISLTGRMDIRRRILSLCSVSKIPLAVVVHPRADISPSASIGAGSVVLSSARVGSEAKIGSNVFLSAFVNVEHHCVIGDNVTFGPGVFLSGEVTVGSSCVFGTNVGVEPGLTIGSGAIIASGVTVLSDVGASAILKHRM